MKPQDFCPRLRAYAREDTNGITWDMEAIAVDFIALAKAGGMEEADFLRNLHRTWPEVELDIHFPKKDLN